MNRSVRAHDEAGQASAVEGVVVQDGPDGVAVTMTPDAAEQTAQNLISAAATARQQEGGAPPAD